MRPSATIRGDRAASDPSTTPSSVMTPARNSSATTSMIPEPQIPVMPVVPARLLEARLVGPGVDADDPESRLERLAVDADALDGAGRGALPAGDLGALERGAGRARCGEEPALVAEDDLGVRPDVDDQRHPLGLVRLLGEDHPGRVGADVAGDARQQVDAGAGVGAQPELGGGRLDRPVRGQRERRAAERRRVDAEDAGGA